MITPDFHTNTGMQDLLDALYYRETRVEPYEIMVMVEDEPNLRVALDIGWLPTKETGEDKAQGCMIKISPSIAKQLGHVLLRAARAAAKEGQKRDRLARGEHE